jgi:hypothetical protein
LTIFIDSIDALRMAFPIIPGRVEFQSEPVPPEPGEMIAGDTLFWKRSFGDYPASAGWTLAYVLNSPTVQIVVSSGDITTDGDGFVVAISSSETKITLAASRSVSWIWECQKSPRRARRGS